MSSVDTKTGSDAVETEIQVESRTETGGERESVCPECGARLTTDAGRAETTCTECGLVVTERHVDRGPEWRSFDTGERNTRSRVGAPTTKLLHDKGLSSHIGWENRDGKGSTLSPSQRRRMGRLRTWDERFRAKSHDDRNLKQALGEIQRMGSALGLPDEVRETASVIYRRAQAEDLLPGRTIEAISTAALYAAARQMDNPRSIDEVAAVSRIGEQEFKRAYRYLVRELELPVKPANPQQFIGRLASALDAEPATERQARALLTAAEGTGIFTGKSPVGLAAAALYAGSQLSGERLTQDQVSEVAEVSNVTIRNRYKELLEQYEKNRVDAAGRV